VELIRIECGSCTAYELAGKGCTWGKIGRKYGGVLGQFWVQFNTL